MIKSAISSEVTIKQNNSTAISEPSLLYATPTPSVDAPGDVDSKMTLGYNGGDNSENETSKQTQCLCDDSKNFTLSENAALYKGRSSPREEKDGKFNTFYPPKFYPPPPDNLSQDDIPLGKNILVEIILYVGVFGRWRVQDLKQGCAKPIAREASVKF
jgi:hypothetical protein